MQTNVDHIDAMQIVRHLSMDAMSHGIIQPCEIYFIWTSEPPVIFVYHKLATVLLTTLRHSYVRRIDSIQTIKHQWTSIMRGEEMGVTLIMQTMLVTVQINQGILDLISRFHHPSKPRQASHFHPLLSLLPHKPLWRNLQI